MAGGFLENFLKGAGSAVMLLTLPSGSGLEKWRSAVWTGSRVESEGAHLGAEGTSDQRPSLGCLSGREEPLSLFVQACAAPPAHTRTDNSACPR